MIGQQSMAKTGTNQETPQSAACDRLLRSSSETFEVAFTPLDLVFNSQLSIEASTSIPRQQQNPRGRSHHAAFQAKSAGGPQEKRSRCSSTDSANSSFSLVQRPIVFVRNFCQTHDAKFEALTLQLHKLVVSAHGTFRQLSHSYINEPESLVELLVTVGQQIPESIWVVWISGRNNTQGKEQTNPRWKLTLIDITEIELLSTNDSSTSTTTYRCTYKSTGERKYKIRGLSPFVLRMVTDTGIELAQFEFVSKACSGTSGKKIQSQAKDLHIMTECMDLAARQIARFCDQIADRFGIFVDQVQQLEDRLCQLESKVHFFSAVTPMYPGFTEESRTLPGTPVVSLSPAGVILPTDALPSLTTPTGEFEWPLEIHLLSEIDEALANCTTEIAGSQDASPLDNETFLRNCLDLSRSKENFNTNLFESE